MDRKFGFISVDDHAVEHPRVWTDRLPKAKWGERVPHVERRPDGSERWIVDGQELPLPGVAFAGAVMPDRAREPQCWEEVPATAAVPSERLKAMDVDGVDCSVLYPSVAGPAGETFGRLTDPKLELACARAYNDWLVDEWAAASPRFVPQCLVPLGPVEATVAELRRAVARGHRGLVFPATPMMLREVPHINEPYWDPVWAACQELEIPLCLHAGPSKAIQFPAYAGFSPGLAAAMEAITRPASSILIVANFLFSRILTRFPTLKVVFAETSLAWGAYELELADHQFERQRLHMEGYEHTPSELFRRQCYYTGWFDHTGVDTRQYIGVNNILWSSNFPLATSSWPNSRDFIARCFAGASAAERDQMLWNNAAALYHL